MAGGATADGIEYLLNLVRGGDTVVASYHVALVQTTPPGFGIGGDELDEPDAEDGYARAQLINDSSAWDLSGTTLSTLNEVSYPPATAAWGRLDYWAICDQPTGGRVLFTGQFDEPIYVEVGGEVFLPAGSVGIDMGGNQWLMGVQ